MTPKFYIAFVDSCYRIIDRIGKKLYINFNCFPKNVTSGFDLPERMER